MSFCSSEQLVNTYKNTVNINGRVFAHTLSCQASFFVKFYDNLNLS